MSAFSVHKPPLYPLSSHEHVKVFLAGSIEMGKAKLWQDGIVERLNSESGPFSGHRWEIGHVYNPRREDWDSSWTQSIGNDNFRNQVTWELDHIDKSEVIFFYFQGQTMSPISLLELGMALASNKRVVVHCDADFWRKGNVEVICSRYKVNVHSDFEAAFSELSMKINECMS